MTNPAKRSLPPEVRTAIDTALSDLERTVSGVSRDPQVRDEVEAAVEAALGSLDRVVPEATEADTSVEAALGSLDRVVPEATEADTRQVLTALAGLAPALAGLAPATAELAELIAAGVSSVEATREEIEKLGRAALEEAPPGQNQKSK